MKKLILSILAGATALAAVPFSAVTTASAGEKQTVFLEEQFAGDALDVNKWTTNGESANLIADRESGRLSVTEHLESYHFGVKNAIQNLDYMQFDIKFTEPKWMAMYFKSKEKVEMADYHPEMFMNMGGKGEFSTDGSKFKYSTSKMPVTPGDWMTMKFKRINSTTMHLFMCPLGENVDNATPVTITIGSAAVSFDNFYFAIACEGGQKYELDNFKVVSENLNFEERFYDEELDSNLKGYGKITNIILPDSGLTMVAAKEGDGIIYNAAVGKETSVISTLEVLKAQYSVSFKDAAEGDAFAFAFGMTTGDYKTKSYALIMEKDGAKIVAYENGAESVVMEKVALNLAGTEDTVLKLIVNKQGTVSLYVKENEVASCEIAEEDFYVGTVGFVAVKDNAGSVLIDNVRLLTKTYKVPVTKSVSHNFSNDFFGNKGYEDFVLSYSEGGSNMYVSGGKLVWENCEDTAYFGSAHEYDNFVLDYKLCSIKTGPNGTANNKWIGLDVGRNIPGKSQYGTHFMLLYEITPTGSGVNLNAYTHETSTLNQGDLNKQITQHKPIPASYFTAIQYDGTSKMESDIKDGDALCVRYVAENGTIRMYLKKASESEYTLYATVEGVDTMGYVTLNCTGWTTMKLDDFSCSNISSVYINADTFAPEKIVETNTVVVYDKNNVDVLGLEEARKNSGCGSTVAATWCVVPMLAAGAALLKKRKNGGD